MLGFILLGDCPTNLFDVDICRCLPASFLKPTVEIGILVIQIKGFFFIEFIFFPTVKVFSAGGPATENEHKLRPGL